MCFLQACVQPFDIATRCCHLQSSCFWTLHSTYRKESNVWSLWFLFWAAFIAVLGQWQSQAVLICFDSCSIITSVHLSSVLEPSHWCVLSAHLLKYLPVGFDFAKMLPARPFGPGLFFRKGPPAHSGFQAWFSSAFPPYLTGLNGVLPWCELCAFEMISLKEIRPLEEESYENIWSSKWEEMNVWTKLVMGRQKEKEMRRILKEANGLEKRLCEIQIQPAGVAWWSVKHCAVSEKMAFMDQSHHKRCQGEEEVESEVLNNREWTGWDSSGEMGMGSMLGTP